MVTLIKRVAILLLMCAATQSARADEKLIAFGEYLSGECVTCHRLSGKTDGIPAIVGWDREIFVSVFDEYRQKVRPNEAMQTIASRLTDEEVAALATYFETIKPQP